MEQRVVICFLAMLYLVSGATTDDLLQILKNRSATIYCGKNLSDVLSLVCKGKYNTPSAKVHDHQKREDTYGQMERVVLQFPFASKTSTANILANFRRRRRRYPRGVYNECCQRPCSYEVLKSYCAD